MNTVIFEHVDNSTAELLKQLAEKMGLHFKSQKEKKEKAQPGVVTNPELLKTIEDYENGKLKLIKMNFSELEKHFKHA